MGELFNPERLGKEIEALGRGDFLADPLDLIADALALFTPPENISTVECAERYRKIRTPKGDGTQNWRRELTPYNVGAMDALDDPAINEVIMVKPARTGGTVVAENYAFKQMRFGPMVDIGWYLKSKSEIDAYADKGFADLFSLHPEIGGKLEVDNAARKVIAGREFVLNPAAPSKFTNRQYGFMVGDEIDTYERRMCSSFVDQARIRARALGSNRKAFTTSHPDRGWTTGIAAAWLDTSRGIYVWPCAECKMWSSPHPTKYWPDVPVTKLWYRKADEGADRDVRIRLAQETAALQCPHCGALVDDDQRHRMIDLGQWMHRGQTLDVDLGICDEREPNASMGFWVHGTMSKMISLADLARDMESAVATYETTRKVDRLREVTAKVFGEVFEGAGKAGAVDVGSLIKRRRETHDKGHGFEQGSAPDGVLFITQSVDVGHGKFDLMRRGWDREGRSWLIDRQTIRQRMVGGQLRDIRTSERIDDWHVLDDWIDGKVPLASDPTRALPIAITLIDAGDGNVTWKAYEYARRMSGRTWTGFSAVRVIKGATSAKAPELPASGTPIAKDQNGREVRPLIRLYTLGVHKLRELELERLAVTDGGPGQWSFADGISRKHLEEFFGERLVAGSWERHGDNETLDLAGYCEAGRQMLQPDRKDIIWTDPARRPVWARPIALYSEGGDHAAPVGGSDEPAAAKRPSIFERTERMNRKAKPNG